MSPALLQQFLDELADAVADRVAARLTADRSSTVGSDNPLISWRDAGVPARTWRKAVKTRALIATKVGREYKAARSEVDRWLGANVVEPVRLEPAAPDSIDSEIGELINRGKLRVVK